MNDITGLGQLLGPFSESAAELLKRLLGPAADEAGLALGEGVRVFRARALAEILDRTKEIPAKRDKPAAEVKPKLLVPILESASLEDDDWMKERWAELLATAASEDQGVHPAFTTILSELTRADARWLQRVARQLEDSCFSLEAPDKDAIHIDNWVRLGLAEVVWRSGAGTIRVGRDGLSRPTVDLVRQFRLTALGGSFLQACGAYPE